MIDLDLDLAPVTTAAAWRGDVLSKSQDWVYMLSGGEIEELERLGTRFVEEDPDLRFVQAADYPLSSPGDATSIRGAASFSSAVCGRISIRTRCRRRSITSWASIWETRSARTSWAT